MLLPPRGFDRWPRPPSIVFRLVQIIPESKAHDISKPFPLAVSTIGLELSHSAKGRHFESIRVNLVSPCHSRFFSAVLHSFLGLLTPLKELCQGLTQFTKPLFLSPFLAPFSAKEAQLPTTSGKNRPEEHRRRDSPAAPSAPVRFAPGGLPGCPPVRSAFAPLWAQGRESLFRALPGDCTAVSRAPAYAPCSSLPSASGRALLMRLYELSCADGKGGGWLSRP